MRVKKLNLLLEQLGIDNYTISGDFLILYEEKDVEKILGKDTFGFQIVYKQRREEDEWEEE